MRSKEKLHLRYTEVISDGDTKTVSHLNDVNPYGEGVMIVKHECVGHVQKRVGTRLRTVKPVSNNCVKGDWLSLCVGYHQGQEGRS